MAVFADHGTGGDFFFAEGAFLFVFEAFHNSQDVLFINILARGIKHNAEIPLRAGRHGDIELKIL